MEDDLTVFSALSVLAPVVEHMQRLLHSQGALRSLFFNLNVKRGIGIVLF